MGEKSNYRYLQWKQVMKGQVSMKGVHWVQYFDLANNNWSAFLVDPRVFGEVALTIVLKRCKLQRVGTRSSNVVNIALYFIIFWMSNHRYNHCIHHHICRDLHRFKLEFYDEIDIRTLNLLKLKFLLYPISCLVSNFRLRLKKFVT